MDNKYQSIRSRLPRMSGSDSRRSNDSSIPRPQKFINNKLINCNNNGTEDQNTSNNSTKYKSIGSIGSPKREGIERSRREVKPNETNGTNGLKSTSLCKSQSLNEIQYQNSEYISKANVLSNGCDSVKAFSFEQLDENFSNSDSNYCFNSTKDYINSELNLMEMSIDESSTASLGLLPIVMSSSLSPFDAFNQNIPFVSIESDFNDNNRELNKKEMIYCFGKEGDEDSETGIPVIQDQEDADMTITNMNERSNSPHEGMPSMASNRENGSFESNCFDNTMESICSVVNQEMADEFETMNLDNSSTLKSNTDNESNNDMSIESNGENCNLSETNIPLNNEFLINKNNLNNDLNKMSEKSDEKSLYSSDKSIVKSLNENKANDCNKNRVKVMKSTAIRPNYLNTCSVTSKDPKIVTGTGTEKVQRAASPSARAPVRKKFKTPGRWDAVMSKIEKSKTSTLPNNKSVKGKVNSNPTRNPVLSGSLPKISPLDELSVINNDNNSSHNPSTHSVKTNINLSNVKKNTLNSNASKVCIPKSKTFVRDSNGNQSTGSRSQQPSIPSIPTTPVTPQPTQQSIERQTMKKERDRDRGFASINDKKTANRRSTQTNSTGAALTSKRMTNTKTNGSNANCSKRDVRSTQLIDDKQQIQKLTQLCETKTKQLKSLGSEHNYMRLAFDSLSVVIQHLIEQYEPFDNPKIKEALEKANKRCEQLKDNLDAKDIELNDMKLIFEEQINQLMKEREKNFCDLNQAKVSHESNVKKLREMHSFEVKRLEEKHKRDLQLSDENRNQLMNEIEAKNSELNETKQSRDALEIRVNQMEDNIMNDKDKKFKYLTEKAKQLELEVDSLKVVMDMKNEKIHTLERKMIETQEKINELPFAKETIRSLQQQIETLQITLDRKIHQFNQLTREHEDLKCEYEREMREKRRLSMKNEELAFHLSESFNESMNGLNNCSNFDRFKSPAISIDETPIKTNRSISINSGSNALASHRKSHSRVNRSVSISTSTSTSTAGAKGTPATRCPTFGSLNESHFLTNEVFESGTGFTDPNRLVESGRKCHKVKRFAISDETPPQSILDSGFEEIQGLNSLSK